MNGSGGQLSLYRRLKVFSYSNVRHFFELRSALPDRSAQHQESTNGTDALLDHAW